MQTTTKPALTREELRACIEADEIIHGLEERIAILESRLTRATAIMDGMPRASGPRDAVGEGVAALEALRGRWAEAVAAWAVRAARIEDALESLSGETRSIMKLRYLDGLTWEQVAERADRTDRWCYVLHKRALEALGCE